MKIRKLVLGLLVLSCLFPSVSAQAGQYDIKEMTPEVSQAIKNRQARYETIQDLKKKNSIGENNRGYVEALDNHVSDIVTAENKDRGVIYQTIASQNQLGASGLGVIEKVFAEVQRDKAQSAESIQLLDGQWVKK